ncbi:MAG: hypothetical protein J6P73_02785 [Bacteroidales bacterium]|nr:hypothetical protein [Bacteroidales bacterium]
MKRFLLPIALLACVLATSCNTEKRLYKTGMAYHQANQADHERIMELKATGKPDVWFEIFERYCSIKGRSDEMARFPAEVKKNLNYKPIKIDDELNGARNKAEAYLTAKINQTLSSDSADLDKADKLIRDLERVNCDNKRLGDFKLKSLAKRYGGLDGMIHLDIRHQQVSPNRDETVTFKETQGDLTATVTDHKLSKSATIEGKVLFIDPKGKHVLLTMPFKTTSNFEHSYSVVDGPMEACSAKTLEGVQQKPVPFPTDQSMLEDAETKLMDMIFEKIQ